MVGEAWGERRLEWHGWTFCVHWPTKWYHWLWFDLRIMTWFDGGQILLVCCGWGCNLDYSRIMGRRRVLKGAAE